MNKFLSFLKYFSLALLVLILSMFAFLLLLGIKKEIQKINCSQPMVIFYSDDHNNYDQKK